MYSSTWENPVRASLCAGKPVLGGTVTTSSVEIAAQMAQLGFDYLWFEMEHSPITLETLRHMVLATRGLPAVPIARVPVVETWTAKRVLDMGVLGVVFPFTSTPELAQTAAAACRYPPQGKRGFAGRLPAFRWPSEESYQDFADRNVLTIAIIEEARAVDNVEAIAATPGIDVLFVGTSDLSFSMGLRGNTNAPQVQEALDRVACAAKVNGKFAGLPAFDAKIIEKNVPRGYLFFQGPADVTLIASGAQGVLECLGKTGVKMKAAY